MSHDATWCGCEQCNRYLNEAIAAAVEAEKAKVSKLVELMEEMCDLSECDITPRHYCRTHCLAVDIVPCPFTSARALIAEWKGGK
jgi:hypothetical protein